MGGREFVLEPAFIIICWAVRERVVNFHPPQTFLEATMHYSASFETQVNPTTFNCYSFRQSEMNTNTKGCVAKIKAD